MELKVKTLYLQEMVTRSIKCVSNNKLIPLTSLMNIKVKNNTLSLTTTDATNYFYVYMKNAGCDDFEISVMADLFTKLVQKTTSDITTLVIDGGTLKVKGSGTYTMELPLDEEGNVIKFPNKLKDESTEHLGYTKLSMVKKVLTCNKNSLATSFELPALTSYYCGDKVITSDSYKICSSNMKLFDKPMLISASLMELLGNVSSEDITVSKREDYILFDTENECIYSPYNDNIDSFPIKPIEDLIDSPFVSNCVVSRKSVLEILDRLSLFVSPYDKKGIYLTFTKDGIMFSSKKSSGVEIVPYIESNEFKDYTCCIDIEMLKSQISTQAELEQIKMYYGSDVSVKMVTDDITQIVALMDDERFETEGEENGKE